MLNPIIIIGAITLLYGAYQELTDDKAKTVPKNPLTKEAEKVKKETIENLDENKTPDNPELNGENDSEKITTDDSGGDN